MVVDIVTGAEGFIGRALVRELLSCGHTVYGIGVEEDALVSLSHTTRYHSVVATFEEYSKLSSVLKGTRPNVFYHCAWAGGFTSALIDHDLQMRNASAAADAILIAHEMGCQRFVQAGTYNECEIATLLTMERPSPRLTCIYSVAKTSADILCRVHAERLGIEYLTGLIPMPYGIGNRSMQLVNVVIKSLLVGVSPKLIEGTEPYDLVHVNDIARGLVAIGERGINRSSYYVGHRNLRSFRSIIEEIRDVIAPEVELRFGEYKDNHLIDYSKVDLDALWRDTGFECSVSLSEGIASTAEWVRENLL